MRQHLFWLPVAVYASDAPTDEGQISGRMRTEISGIAMVQKTNISGEGNYGQDPDSGEWMEANNAGWTEEEGYF